MWPPSLTSVAEQKPISLVPIWSATRYKCAFLKHRRRLLSTHQRRFDLTSRLQLANSPAILKVSEPVPVVVPLPPNAAQTGLKPINAGAVGNLTISLAGATAMVSVLSVIEILNSYALQPVAVKWSSLNQSPSVEIEASFAIVNQ
jgi:hypothetical protein